MAPWREAERPVTIFVVTGHNGGDGTERVVWIVRGFLNRDRVTRHRLRSRQRACRDSSAWCRLSGFD